MQRKTPRNVFEAVKRRTAFRPKPATEPTNTVPGSIEKIQVMATRALNGEELFHPDDRTFLTHRGEQ